MGTDAEVSAGKPIIVRTYHADGRSNGRVAESSNGMVRLRLELLNALRRKGHLRPDEGFSLRNSDVQGATMFYEIEADSKRIFRGEASTGLGEIELRVYEV